MEKKLRERENSQVKEWARLAYFWLLVVFFHFLLPLGQCQLRWRFDISIYWKYTQMVTWTSNGKSGLGGGEKEKREWTLRRVTRDREKKKCQLYLAISVVGLCHSFNGGTKGKISAEWTFVWTANFEPGSPVANESLEDSVRRGDRCWLLQRPLIQVLKLPWNWMQCHCLTDWPVQGWPGDWVGWESEREREKGQGVTGRESIKPHTKQTAHGNALLSSHSGNERGEGRGWRGKKMMLLLETMQLWCSLSLSFFLSFLLLPWHLPCGTVNNEIQWTTNREQWGGGQLGKCTTGRGWMDWRSKHTPSMCLLVASVTHTHTKSTRKCHQLCSLNERENEGERERERERERRESCLAKEKHTHSSPIHMSQMACPLGECFDFGQCNW